MRQRRKLRGHLDMRQRAAHGSDLTTAPRDAIATEGGHNCVATRRPRAGGQPATTTSTPAAANSPTAEGVAEAPVTRVHGSGSRAQAWNGRVPSFAPCART